MADLDLGTIGMKIRLDDSEYEEGLRRMEENSTGERTRLNELSGQASAAKNILSVLSDIPKIFQTLSKEILHLPALPFGGEEERVQRILESIQSARETLGDMDAPVENSLRGRIGDSKVPGPEAREEQILSASDSGNALRNSGDGNNYAREQLETQKRIEKYARITAEKVGGSTFQ